MDTNKAIVIMTCSALAMIVFGFAAQTGTSRAEALKECYKAAQVNQKITCEVANSPK